MTSVEILSPPEATTMQQARGIEMPLQPLSSVTPVTETGAVPVASVTKMVASWKADSLSTKQKFGLDGLLDAKAAPADVVALEKYVQPVDRGPAAGAGAGAAAPADLLRSWQYQVTGKLATAQVLAELGAVHLKSGGPQGIQAEACKHIAVEQLDDTFYIVDLGNVMRMFKAWRAAMPRVTPFYAIKCNPEPGMLKLLMELGAGFDCASMGELDMMLNMGVHPSRIIFAHPCKRQVDIRYARERGVQYTTFDTESELHKMAALNPEFKCVLRIRADDPDARVPLGLKYGAEVDEAPGLLRTAKQLGLNVVGVSFHVGSACKNLATFTGAIENARKIFDEADSLGFKMEMLDIGGGFTGHFDEMGNVMFGEIANTINAAIAVNFPPEMGVRVIAEPGRYFAETSASLLTPIYGQRDRKAADGSIKKDYWLTDGLYGSFNCILYDGQNPGYRVLRSPLLPEPKGEAATATFPSTLWGPTCDSADCVYKDVDLPALRNGDWLMWNNAGAYTVAGACDFNGIAMTSPRYFYVYSDSAVDVPAAADSKEAVAEVATA